MLQSYRREWYQEAAQSLCISKSDESCRSSNMNHSSNNINRYLRECACRPQWQILQLTNGKKSKPNDYFENN